MKHDVGGRLHKMQRATLSRTPSPRKDLAFAFGASLAMRRTTAASSKMFFFMLVKGVRLLGCLGGTCFYGLDKRPPGSRYHSALRTRCTRSREQP